MSRLIFADASATLNLNGLNLYYKTLVGNPEQLIGAPLAIIDIIAQPEKAPVNTEVTVIGSFTGDASSTFTATFDWGDLTTSEGIIDNGTATGTHIYTTHGIFDVTLTVTDTGAGISQFASAFVTISSPPVAVAGGPYIVNVPKRDVFEETHVLLKKLSSLSHPP